MKKFSIFMLAALALVACNKEQNAVVEQPAEADQIPVGFSAYVNRPSTKAGAITPNLTTGTPGNSGVDTNGIMYYDPEKGAIGFGVFAYYTNADNYDQSYMPNFMYNQQVVYKKLEGGADTDYAWQYSPVKYWPNEFGKNAQSDDADKISFFAYAPYVSVNPASGKVNAGATQPTSFIPGPGDDGNATYGIVGMKRNNATGDPMIQYISRPFTNQQVDLVWGTAASSMSNWTLKLQSSTPQNIAAGTPLLNIQHPFATSQVTIAGGHATSNAQRVAFDFKHSLAQLIVTVDTKTNNTIPADPDGNTKVFIRSVTFEGFETKAALNLNNSEAAKALWYNFDCSNELNNGAEFTIYDGRKDGKEGVTAATKEFAAINPYLVQHTTFLADSVGVTGTARNLFGGISTDGLGTSTIIAPSDPNPASDEYAPILVIPNGDKLKVTIEYDVLTKDSNLAGMLNDGITQGSVVKNVISRWITKDVTSPTLVPGTGSATEPNASSAIVLQNGLVYKIKLHLGLNSVEFTGEITEWADGDNGGADLPHNNPVPTI